VSLTRHDGAPLVQGSASSTGERAIHVMRDEARPEVRRFAADGLYYLFTPVFGGP
jgi:hypothetical protein